MVNYFIYRSIFHKHFPTLSDIFTGGNIVRNDQRFLIKFVCSYNNGETVEKGKNMFVKNMARLFSEGFHVVAKHHPHQNNEFSIGTRC